MNRRAPRLASRRSSPDSRRRLRLEALEARRVLAAFAVTTAADVIDAEDGLTSLREAIDLANQNAGLDTITFAEGSFDPLGFASPTQIDLALGELQVTDDLVLVGPSADRLVIDGQNASRVFAISGDSIDVLIEGLTISGGQVTAPEGSGAAIRFESAGRLTLRGVGIIGNQTTGQNGNGGGLWAAGGQVDIVQSTLANNATSGVGSSGGAIAVVDTELRVINSTLSGNVVSGVDTIAGGDGGGVHADGASTVLLVHATVVSNSVVGLGGGVYAATDSESTLEIVNSIIAENSSAGVAVDISPALSPIGTTNESLDVFSSLIGDNSGSGLMESQSPDANGNLIGAPFGGGLINPELAPLALAGGPLLIHKPAGTSPAIDGGDDSRSLGLDNLPLTADGRGDPFLRGFSTVDMGSFEAQPPRPVVIAWPAPDPILLGTTLGPSQLNATTGVPGTFQYTPAPDSLLNLGTDQTLSVVFTPTDTVHYRISNASVTIDVMPRADRGDAPESYGVLAIDDGPSHLESLLTLGDSVDVEVDGQPSITAEGDGDDEDGVAFVTGLVADPQGDTTGMIEVTVSAASRLDAWIDFNDDGTFDPVNEHLGGGTSIDLIAGVNRLPITIPMGTVPGETFGRFRVSTDGDLSPTGEAADGEVEDYLVTLADSTNPMPIEVTVTGPQITLRADGDELVVLRRDVEVFRAPRSSISRLDITGDEFSNVLTIDQSFGDAIPSGGLSFDGVDRVNTVRWVGATGTIDLAAGGNIELANVDAVDITDAEAQAITIDGPAARRIDPTGGGLVITGGAEDSIIFSDPEQWRMDAPEIVFGTTFTIVRTLGTFVQTDLGSGWQNLPNPSDINGDGDVTANDALRIINELGRRSFSDSETSILVDPATVDPWPGNYYDQNGDGLATALDALRVINQLARLNASASESESVMLMADIWSQWNDWREGRSELF